MTLATDKIDDFRRLANDFYDELGLDPVQEIVSILPKVDITLEDFAPISLELYDEISKLEPFGKGNEEPIFEVENALVVARQDMGDKKQHIKLTLSDGVREIRMLKFNAADEMRAEIGEKVAVRFSLSLNEWQGRRSVEGMILYLEREEL